MKNAKVVFCIVFFTLMTICILPVSSNAQIKLKKFIKDAKELVNEAKDLKKEAKDLKKEAKETKKDAEGLLKDEENRGGKHAITVGNGQTSTGYTKITVQNVDFMALSELSTFMEELPYVKKVNSAFSETTAVFEVDCRKNTQTLVTDLLGKSGYALNVTKFDATSAELKKE